MFGSIRNYCTVLSKLKRYLVLVYLNYFMFQINLYILNPMNEYPLKSFPIIPIHIFDNFDFNQGELQL